MVNVIAIVIVIVISHSQKMGLIGFDSGMRWYVSMQSVVGWLFNPSFQRIIWRKQLCSRCLIEV